jgi:hypothetical protein
LVQCQSASGLPPPESTSGSATASTDGSPPWLAGIVSERSGPGAVCPPVAAPAGATTAGTAPSGAMFGAVGPDWVSRGAVLPVSTVGGAVDSRRIPLAAAAPLATEAAPAVSA